MSIHPLQQSRRLRIDLVKGHLFVVDLYEEKIATELPAWFSIIEFRYQKGRPNWVKLMEHEFIPNTWNPEGIRSVRLLYACRGHFLVTWVSEDEVLDDITPLYVKKMLHDSKFAPER